MTDDECILIGKIYTLDETRPEAEAVAIRNGRICCVGDADEARRGAGPRCEIIDLGDRVAFPGFIESHSHPVLLGRYLEEVDCRNCASIQEIVEVLRRRASATPPGEWVIGNGYDHTLLRESRHPTRHELDRASEKHPVLLRNITVHNVVANGEALRTAGVNARTPDPEGGRIGRDEHGEPDGVLWEWAQSLVQSHLPEASVDDVRRQLERAAEEYVSAGVTSVVDAALGLANGMRDVEAYADIAGDGGLPLRMGAAITYPLWKELQGGAGPGLAWPGDSEKVRPVAVKFFQDGSIQIGTAALRQPYFGETEPADHHLIWSQEELNRAVADAHSSGWQVWTHGNGDVAIGSILDAYEKALADEPREDHRHRVEHCQTAGEDQLDRIRDLGVAVSFFTVHVWYWGDRHRDVFLGPERAARLDPLASALKRGTRFGLHNDSPVTPISPLLSIGTAVSRITSGGKVLGAEQTITLHQALRSMTLDSAYLAFEEDVKGTLTEGKLGDVVILGMDPYEVMPEEIKDVPVAATIVGGKLVYGAI
ncbi:MAG TPA: amidohydrolase [Rubrobacteraceae bacterium]|nr:amidohydrolase [Rubrobacteraceae bacterium]